MVKKELTKRELMFYLEEMVQMDLADEIEQRFYEDCKWDGFKEVKHRNDELRHIIHNYREWQSESF